LTEQDNTRGAAPVQALGTARIAALVDGVFAIVLTLLVLDLHAQHSTTQLQFSPKYEVSRLSSPLSLLASPSSASSGTATTWNCTSSSAPTACTLVSLSSFS
jgi:hypothetical protein